MARITRRFLAVTLSVGVLAAVVALATHLVVLVTTFGVSMLPEFHTGDLAVLAPAGSYHVGEVVGYRSPLLHITVLHRIVADQDGLFTFKGDNNRFVDPVRLPASAIVGRLVVEVPYGGRVLIWLRSPLGLGLIALLAVGSGGVFVRSRRRTVGVHSRRRSASVPVRPLRAVRSSTIPADPRRSRLVALAPGAGVRPTAVRPSRSAVPDPWWMLALPAAVILAGGLLAAGAFVAPTRSSGSRPVAYGQSLSFSYSADVAAGPAYPTGTVSTGEPVFLDLVKRLDVAVRYDLVIAPGAHSTVTGLARAGVYIDGPDGWSTDLGTPSVASLKGSRLSIDLPVDLNQLGATEAAFTHQTGIPLADPILRIQADVVLSGTVDGRPVRAHFAPAVTLIDSGGALTLVGPTSAAAPGPIGFTQNGAVTVPFAAAARTDVLGHEVAVSGERRVAAGILLTGLLGAAIGAVVVSRRRRWSERKRIRSRFGDNMVPIASPLPPETHVTAVGSIRSLHQLARRYECPLLELVDEHGTAYYVDSGPLVYGFRLAEPGAEPSILTDLDVVRPAS